MQCEKERQVISFISLALGFIHLLCQIQVIVNSVIIILYLPRLLSVLAAWTTGPVAELKAFLLNLQ